MLGHHVSGMRMALTYSRDSASRPLRVLERLLSEIRSGVFEPDASRSCRLLKRKREDMIEESVAVPSADSDSKKETQKLSALKILMTIVTINHMSPLTPKLIQSLRLQSSLVLNGRYLLCLALRFTRNLEQDTCLLKAM